MNPSKERVKQRRAIALAMAKRAEADLERNSEGLQQLSDLPDSTKIPVNLKRNDKCPCGSGKKVKKCHSALLKGLKLQKQKRITEGVLRGAKAVINNGKKGN